MFVVNFLLMSTLHYTLEIPLLLFSYPKDKIMTHHRHTNGSLVVLYDVLATSISNGMFHPLNSLVVSRNLWQILLGKIWLYLNLVKHSAKFYKSLRIQNLCLFPLASCCWIIHNFVIFYWIKDAKHIWDLYCHLSTETGSWFILL